ncbi:Oidioi.mRNA.OKI2018_I69.XSR.g15611.t1.cds [Oikopleura dioica]|uniref:Oidioi.mRNA.OKI2018_I69.XSR.g15611.t1.cds n=1 Tax=Oikopleura dioica TaxID=34765 RepID=A0ABN7SDD9_OIKDI|nr:Oidioi.mRNA.OKI2018_I69.XSR.g15611.t1.cds [Oikopleura dioica]
MLVILASIFGLLSAREVPVELIAQPVVSSRDGSIQCFFDLELSDRLKGLTWKRSFQDEEDEIIMVLDGEGQTRHALDGRFSSFLKNATSIDSKNRFESLLRINEVSTSDDQFDYNCEITFMDSVKGAFHQSDSETGARLKVLRPPSTPYLTIDSSSDEAVFKCEVEDLGYPNDASVEILHNGTLLTSQQNAIIEADLKLSPKDARTIVECRTSHESFDLGLAQQTTDEFELVAPQLSGPNAPFSLYLTKKALSQIPAKKVNTNSALGSGTGLSVKIQDKSAKYCHVSVEMDTDALPVPALLVFTGKNQTSNMTPSSGNRMTITLDKNAESTTVVAMSPLGSVGFTFDNSVHAECFPSLPAQTVKKSGSSSFNGAIIAIFVIVILVSVLIGLVFLKRRRDMEKGNGDNENANATMRSVESQDFEAYQPEQNDTKRSQSNRESETSRFVQPNTSLALSDDDADI